MYVVTVTFEIEPDHVEAFRAAVLTQARNSLEHEPGCHRFEVCTDPDDRGIVFLYEIYTDAAAFQAHLETDHFKAFDQRISGWVLSKEVKTWDLAAPTA